MTHRERHHLGAVVGEDLHRLAHRIAGASDHGLLAAVDVGGDDVAVDCVEGALDVLDRGKDGSHQPTVFDVDVRHLASAACNSVQRVVVGERPCGNERAVLAEAVTHHHVRVDAVGRQQLREGEVDGQHGRLGDLRFPQLHVALLHRGRVIGVGEDVVGERLAEDRLHDCVGIAEGLLDDRLAVAERIEHVDVLGALPCVEEGNHLRGALAVEDALIGEELPRRRIAALECCDRLLDLGRQVGCVGVVDGDSHFGTQVTLCGRRRRRGGAGRCVGMDGAEPCQHCGLVGASDDEGAAQRRLEVVPAGADCRGGRHERIRLAFAVHLKPSRDVLLEHDMEVGPAEAERADACRAHLSRLGLPLRQLLVDVER